LPPSIRTSRILSEIDNPGKDLCKVLIKWQYLINRMIQIDCPQYASQALVYSLFPEAEQEEKSKGAKLKEIFLKN
jgi:hypothetical protein